MHTQTQTHGLTLTQASSVFLSFQDLKCYHGDGSGGRVRVKGYRGCGHTNGVLSLSKWIHWTLLSGDYCHVIAATLMLRSLPVCLSRLMTHLSFCRIVPLVFFASHCQSCLHPPAGRCLYSHVSPAAATTTARVVMWRRGRVR